MAVESFRLPRNPQSGSPFCQLPAELRVKILRLCVKQATPLINEDYARSVLRCSCKDSVTYLAEQKRLSSQILRSCQALHDESFRILYGENTLQISAGSLIHWSLELKIFDLRVNMENGLLQTSVEYDLLNHLKPCMAGERQCDLCDANSAALETEIKIMNHHDSDNPYSWHCSTPLSRKRSEKHPPIHNFERLLICIDSWDLQNAFLAFRFLRGLLFAKDVTISLKPLKDYLGFGKWPERRTTKENIHELRAVSLLRCKSLEFKDLPPDVASDHEALQDIVRRVSSDSEPEDHLAMWQHVTRLFVDIPDTVDNMTQEQERFTRVFEDDIKVLERSMLMSDPGFVKQKDDLLYKAEHWVKDREDNLVFDHKDSVEQIVRRTQKLRSKVLELSGDSVSERVSVACVESEHEDGTLQQVIVDMSDRRSIPYISA